MSALALGSPGLDSSARTLVNAVKCGRPSRLRVGALADCFHSGCLLVQMNRGILQLCPYILGKLRTGAGFQEGQKRFTVTYARKDLKTSSDQCSILNSQ